MSEDQRMLGQRYLGVDHGRDAHGQRDAEHVAEPPRVHGDPA